MSNNLNAIARQIDKAERDLIEQRSNRGEEEDGIAVLFTGNWNDSFPRALVLDQQLDPTEKITWQAIRLTINNPARPGSLPRREELAMMVNCSGPTITKARAMLRVCRWMTFCKTVRKQGRFVGDIFLFNDEPMSLEATLNFDPHYIPFIQSQTQSGNKRLRTIASHVLREIDALNGIEIPTELDKLAARATAWSPWFVGGEPENESSTSPHSHQSKIFATVRNSPKTLIPTQTQADQGIQSKIFAAVETENNLHLDDQSKIFAAVENDQSKIFTDEKIFLPHARGSNNNYINNKNINTRARDDEKNVNTESQSRSHRHNANPNPQDDPEKTFTLAIEEFPELASNAIKKYVVLTFHGRENHLPIIKRILSQSEEPTRIELLLQLIGRRAAYHHGWVEQPLHNAIAFMKELAARSKQNEFFPDEWALELHKSLASGEVPAFFDSPEQMRKNRMYQFIDYGDETE